LVYIKRWHNAVQFPAGATASNQNQNRQSEYLISHSVATEDSSLQRDGANVSEHGTVLDMDTCPALPLPSHSTGVTSSHNCHFSLPSATRPHRWRRLCAPCQYDKGADRKWQQAMIRYRN